jgi:hypothetical protein
MCSRFLLRRKLEIGFPSKELGFPQDNRRKENRKNYGIEKESKQNGRHLESSVATGTVRYEAADGAAPLTVFFFRWRLRLGATSAVRGGVAPGDSTAA